MAAASSAENTGAVRSSEAGSNKDIITFHAGPYYELIMELVRSGDFGGKSDVMRMMCKEFFDGDFSSEVRKKLRGLGDIGMSAEDVINRICDGLIEPKEWHVGSSRTSYIKYTNDQKLPIHSKIVKMIPGSPRRSLR